MEIQELREIVKDKLIKKNVSLDKKVGRGKYELTCKNCNTIFCVTESNLLHHGFSCPNCYLPKYNIDIFKEKVKDMYGDEYSVISKEYVNSKTKIEMKHNTCGNIYFVTPNKFLIGRKCPKCSHGSALKTQEEYEHDVFNTVGNEYTVLGKYTGANKKIKLKHNICGNEYETSAVSILSGCRCPKCSHSNILKTQDEVMKEISETDSSYDLISEYKGNRFPITLKHLTCGCEFTTTLRNFTHESVRCPNCKDYNTSKFEIEIREFIKSIYSGIVLHNTKLDRKEMDIYIPDKKLCIEADGLYWHSVQKHNTKLNLSEKTKFFNSKGIRVIHIFEDEWTNKKDIIKDKLISIIDCDNNRIYARKCDIIIPDDKQVNAFLNEYHIQGCGSASYKVALEYNNELVAVMTFTKLRKSVTNQKDDSAVELFRFATKRACCWGI